MTFDNDDKYAKHEFRMSQRNSIIGVLILLCVFYFGFLISALNPKEASKSASTIISDDIRNSDLKIPQVEFVKPFFHHIGRNIYFLEEKFHPGTFKTLGKNKFEKEMLDHLNKMIHAYTPKVYNSLETGKAYFFISN